MAGNHDLVASPIAALGAAITRFLRVIRVERANAGDRSQTSSLQNSNRFPSGS
jgi:hypothetical protein